jgi:hypothetical protein
MKCLIRWCHKIWRAMMPFILLPGMSTQPCIIPSHVGSLVWLNFHACKLYYGTLISCKANLILTDNVVLKYYWIPHHVFTVGACMMFQACTHQWGKIIPTLLITPSISGLYVWWYPVIFLLITISYIWSPQHEPVRSISIWLWLLWLSSHRPFHGWDFKLFNVELLSLLRFKAAVLLDMLHHYDFTESQKSPNPLINSLEINFFYNAEVF